jgi:hypothetical protein
VERGDDALPAIGHQYRDAIRSLHGEQQAGLIGDLAVGAARALPARVSARAFDHKVRMELLQGEDRSFGVSADGLGQQAAVSEDGLAVVGCGKAKIQLARRIFSAINVA